MTDGTMSLFADDLLLYRPIQTATDYINLQVDIDNLCFVVNASKCKFMVIPGRGNQTSQLQH